MATSNILTTVVDWRGDLRFEGGAPGKPTALIDAGGDAGPGPMVMLLVSAAACSGADVVGILEKMQVKLKRFQMEVSGLRAEEHPRRYLKLHLIMRFVAEGLDENKAKRAIDLSIQKYCSVVQSLNPDIPISYDIVLES